jgi:hypothetical protein
VGDLITQNNQLVSVTSTVNTSEPLRARDCGPAFRPSPSPSSFSAQRGDRAAGGKDHGGDFVSYDSELLVYKIAQRHLIHIANQTFQDVAENWLKPVTGGRIG